MTRNRIAAVSTMGDHCRPTLPCVGGKGSPRQRFSRMQEMETM